MKIKRKIAANGGGAHEASIGGARDLARGNVTCLRAMAALISRGGAGVAKMWRGGEETGETASAAWRRRKKTENGGGQPWRGIVVAAAKSAG